MRYIVIENKLLQKITQIYIALVRVTFKEKST